MCIHIRYVRGPSELAKRRGDTVVAFPGVRRLAFRLLFQEDLYVE